MLTSNCESTWGPGYLNKPRAYGAIIGARRFGDRSTCSQPDMSGGITIGFVDHAVFLSQSDRVLCASVGSFQVRNW